MTDSSTLETRVAALIAAYADRAPTDVDPMAMTRLAATGSWRGGRAWLPVVPVSRSLGFAFVVLALLAAIVAGALAVGGQLLRRDPVSVVARYGRIHVGWVFVYADGRVLSYPDSGVVLPDGSTAYPILERRLTPDGVDLVRSGAMQPSDFLGWRSRTLPRDAWADPEIRPYEPSTYAVCDWENIERDVPLDVGGLPAPAQALLRGKERTYNVGEFGGGAPANPVECWEVRPDEARALRTILNDGGDPAEIGILVTEVLPHGTWVIWGG